jgi:cytidine deaminase
MSKDRLNDAAETARKNAYAPYSGFKVGAAVLTRAGNVFNGSNIENASFGMTICAERAAVASAVSAGEIDLVSIAIVADSDEPAVPCGACRQVLSEFNRSLEIITSTTNGKSQHFNLKDLHPLPNQGISLRHV